MTLDEKSADRSDLGIMGKTSPGPAVEVYSISWVRYTYEMLMFTGLTGFLTWAATNPQTEAGTLARLTVILVSIPPWYYLYGVAISPKKLVVRDHTLEAIYWRGQSNLYELVNLRVAPSTFTSRALWFSQIVNLQRESQFRIWREADGYQRALSLIDTRNQDN